MNYKSQRKYKILVDTSSNLVVWLTDIDTKYVPSISYTLESRIVHSNTMLDDSYNSYKLFYTHIKGLYIDTPNQSLIQDIGRIRLLRSKANAIDLIMRYVDWVYDKKDRLQRDFFTMVHKNLDERWITYIKQEYNLSSNDAIKFIEFKHNEYSDLDYELNSLSHSLINNVIKAESLEQLLETFQKAMTHFWNPVEFGINDLAPEFKHDLL